jgi:tRNA-dihydrouridine synthase 1
MLTYCRVSNVLQKEYKSKQHRKYTVRADLICSTYCVFCGWFVRIGPHIQQQQHLEQFYRREKAQRKTMTAAATINPATAAADPSATLVEVCVQDAAVASSSSTSSCCDRKNNDNSSSSTNNNITTNHTNPEEGDGPRIPVDREWLDKLLRKHSGNSKSNCNSSCDDVAAAVPRPLVQQQQRKRITAYVLAPMVDQSDLPFRMQCRKYGTNLCFTPMIHAKLFRHNPKYRAKFLPMDIISNGETPLDRPLIAQLCGSDLDCVLYTALAVQPYVDAIDINCGCPQGIAKRGMYGAFLLDGDTPEVRLLPLVRHLLRHLTIPLTVKVRLLLPPPPPNPRPSSSQPDTTESAMLSDREQSLEASLQLYQKMVDAGIHMLTVHGRTRLQKGLDIGHADWDAIKTICDRFGDSIPILANGSVASQAQALACLQHTGADGVMCSEAILEYPPLFEGMAAHDEAVAAAAAASSQGGRDVPAPPPPPRPRKHDRIALALEYLEYARLYPPNVHGQGSGIKCMRMHIHRILHADLAKHADLRSDLTRYTDHREDLLAVVLNVRDRVIEQQQQQQEEEQDQRAVTAVGGGEDTHGRQSPAATDTDDDDDGSGRNLLSWYFRHRDNAKQDEEQRRLYAAQKRLSSGAGGKDDDDDNSTGSCCNDDDDDLCFGNTLFGTGEHQKDDSEAGDY